MLTSGFVPGQITVAAASAAEVNVECPEFLLPTEKGETTMVNHVRNVQNPVEHGPKLKIRGDLANLPLSVSEITSLSAAMNQLCVRLKLGDRQEQCRLVAGDFMEIPSWVGYWQPPTFTTIPLKDYAAWSWSTAGGAQRRLSRHP